MIAFFYVLLVISFCEEIKYNIVKSWRTLVKRLSGQEQNVVPKSQILFSFCTKFCFLFLFISLANFLISCSRFLFVLVFAFWLRGIYEFKRPNNVLPSILRRKYRPINLSLHFKGVCFFSIQFCVFVIQNHPNVWTTSESFCIASSGAICGGSARYAVLVSIFQNQNIE